MVPLPLLSPPDRGQRLYNREVVSFKLFSKVPRTRQCSWRQLAKTKENHVKRKRLQYWPSSLGFFLGLAQFYIVDIVLLISSYITNKQLYFMGIE